MSVWFEGEREIDCSIEQVKHSTESAGDYFTAVVSLLPGLTDVELIEQQADAVTIRTNEGLMKRTNISTRTDPDRVVVDFDEEYRAGSRVTTNSHFTHDYIAADQGVTHRLTIRDLTAPGLLGFFYRRFGASKMGNAFLTAHKTHLETVDT